MDAEAQEKQKKHDNESAADLERVTDYAEEKEINVSDIGDMLAKFAQRSNEKQAEREKELSKVKISKEDVELVMKEMDISKIKAERALRENKGDAVAALTALVNAVLAWLSGVTWFSLLSYYEFNAKCYFSENALLPGLVEPEFHVSERDIFDINKSFANRGISIVALTKTLQNLGLEVYSQDFSFYNGFTANLLPKLQNGTNVYAIARASRGATMESIVVNIPVKWGNMNYATGISALFAKQVRGQMHWAKDIIFLFSDAGLDGVQAWLNVYHGISASNVQAASLPSRAGSIQSAVVLNFNEPSMSYLNLLIEGFNGQLPNLDLINLVVKLSHDNQIPIALNHQFPPRIPLSMDGFKQCLRSTASMMKQQITGTSSGNHGEFLRHNIEAITMESVYIPQSGNTGLVRVGRMLEGICRSLNNLLERFHQSFFFYFLPSLDRYVSIGMYMPALGLVVLAPVLKKTCRSHFPMFFMFYALILLIKEATEETEAKDSSESPPGEQDAAGEGLEEILRETGSKFAEQKVETGSIWQPIILTIVLCHTFGIILHYSSKLSVVWSEMFLCSQVHGFLLVLVAVHIFGMFLPYHIRFPDQSKLHFRIVTLIQSAVVFGTLAIINFALGAALGTYIVFTTLFVQPLKGRWKFVMRSFVLLSSPLVVTGIVAGFNVQGGGLAELFNAFSSIMTNSLELFMTNRSWVYSFVTLIYYPMWLQFWFLVS